MNNLTTTISIRGYVTGAVAFRRPAAAFPTFDDILSAAYLAFGNDAEEFRLHLHFRQGGWCSKDELLERVEWDRGEYFVSGSVEFFAHFMRRDVGGEGNGTRRVAATAKSPDSMAVEQVLALPVFEGRGPVTPGSALYSQPGHASTGQQQAPQLFKRKINQDSTTVFSLHMPIPGKRYGKTKYFSTPSIIIPNPVRAPRSVSCIGSK
tara:strand:+ start:53032 stop:53652 length:621 start_codon:yes stop_codon:yes gene_type:complete